MPHTSSPPPLHCALVWEQDHANSRADPDVVGEVARKSSRAPFRYRDVRWPTAVGMSIARQRTVRRHRTARRCCSNWKRANVAVSEDRRDGVWHSPRNPRCACTCPFARLTWPLSETLTSLRRVSWIGIIEFMCGYPETYITRKLPPYDTRPLIDPYQLFLLLTPSLLLGASAKLFLLSPSR
jgi:hypothetical protein